MKLSRKEKVEKLRALHDREGIFVIPNAWDAGSAKLIAHLGFEAIATTSAGLAFALGKADGERSVTADDTWANARDIVTATELPVSADLENGYGDDPADCAHTIRRAAEVGLAGGSIEDATGREGERIYPFELAVARIEAAVKAARSISDGFVLTARAENLINGIPDLEDTIRRLQAYAAAGADVLYAPGLTRREDIERVVKSVAPKPVNVLQGLSGEDLSVDELAKMGVKRVSLGSSLARAAYDAFLQAAREVREKGTFGYVKGIETSYSDFNRILR